MRSQADSALNSNVRNLNTTWDIVKNKLQYNTHPSEIKEETQALQNSIWQVCQAYFQSHLTQETESKETLKSEYLLPESQLKSFIDFTLTHEKTCNTLPTPIHRYIVFFIKNLNSAVIVNHYRIFNESLQEITED